MPRQYRKLNHDVRANGFVVFSRFNGEIEYLLVRRSNPYNWQPPKCNYEKTLSRLSLSTLNISRIHLINLF